MFTALDRSLSHQILEAGLSSAPVVQYSGEAAPRALFQTRVNDGEVCAYMRRFPVSSLCFLASYLLMPFGGSQPSFVQNEMKWLLNDEFKVICKIKLEAY